MTMETGKDVVAMFFEALATPKSNLTKEYLSGGMSHPPGIIESNERRDKDVR
jgi:hypothetical protein